jgi:hypothetical protein
VVQLLQPQMHSQSCRRLVGRVGCVMQHALKAAGCSVGMTTCSTAAVLRRLRIQCRTHQCTVIASKVSCSRRRAFLLLLVVQLHFILMHAACLLDSCGALTYAQHAGL